MGLKAAKYALTLFLLSAPAWAQEDSRTVKSPDGKLEFQIFVALEGPGAYDRIGYRVLLGGKTVLDTSFLGVDIYEQEPLLGEKPGLTGSKTSSQPGEYNGLLAEYLQNGSTGRRIDVEARVWNQAVAFRYRFPETTAQQEFVLSDEDTEFAYPPGSKTADGRLIANLDRRGEYAFPWIVEEPGAGWVAVNELTSGGFPRAHLVTEQTSIMVTRLDRPTPTTPVVMRAATPLIGPWHVVLLAKDRDRILESPILKDLTR